jgi:hypothetical protein
MDDLKLRIAEVLREELSEGDLLDAQDFTPEDWEEVLNEALKPEIEVEFMEAQI